MCKPILQSQPLRLHPLVVCIFEYVSLPCKVSLCGCIRATVLSTKRWSSTGPFIRYMRGPCHLGLAPIFSSPSPLESVYTSSVSVNGKRASGWASEEVMYRFVERGRSSSPLEQVFVRFCLVSRISSGLVPVLNPPNMLACQMRKLSSLPLVPMGLPRAKVPISGVLFISYRTIHWTGKCAICI